MTASLTQVVQAIETRAETVSGLRAWSYVPEDGNPPFAFVNIGVISRAAMNLGVIELPFELVVLVSRAVDRVGQNALYAFANPDVTDSGSVWKAFETSKNLSLTGLDVTIQRYRPLGLDEVAAYGYFGGAFEGVALITKS